MLANISKKERIAKRQSVEEEKYRSNMEDSDSSFEPSSDEDVKAKPVEIAPSIKEAKPNIKDYEMLGILGEGAFGRVHHVVRKSDGEQFALKLLVKKNMTKKMQNEVQRERMILMKVDHPNIIKLYQAFHDPKNLYFVMDWAENGELFSYMKNEGVLDYKVAQFLSIVSVSYF